MKIKSIRFSENTSSFWDNIIGWIFISLGILVGIIIVLCLPFIFIYDFIKRKIFKIKEEEPDTLEIESVLFENEEFKLVEKSIRELDDNDTDFIYEFFNGIDMYDDDFPIYQIIDKKSPSDLGGCYFIDFSIDTEHHLYLQKIVQEEEEVKTFLISFEKKTGKVEIIKEIGQYILEHYNEKTKTITGYGKEKVIHITLE